MNKLLSWLKRSIYFILSEFLGQIMAAIILVAAYVTWVYFSSGYAAILVIIIGIIIWGLLSKLFMKAKNMARNDNQ